MKELEFKEWLSTKKKFKKNTISSRVSKVKRIDAEYDIDKNYATDFCEMLIDKFNYSKKDAAAGFEPDIDIVIDGSYYNGMASLKQALSLYVEFLNESRIIPKAIPKNDSAALDLAGDVIFEGGFIDFKKFIGPYCRNNVCNMTRPKKEKIAYCQYCHTKATLEAAHIEGKERLSVIKEILEKNFKISNDKYRVNLRNFEKKFTAAQTPVEDNFFFLCKKCHTIYDGKKSITTKMIRDEIASCANV